MPPLEYTPLNAALVGAALYTLLVLGFDLYLRRPWLLVGLAVTIASWAWSA